MVLRAPADARQPAAAIVPPWLWFWLLTYFLGLPNLLALSLPAVTGLLAYRSLPQDVSGLGLEPLLRFTSIAELVPRIAVMAGVMAVFLPWTRAASLERRFGLADSNAGVAAVDEIAAFVEPFAPHARLKVNLLRTDLLAFVYPTGFHGATIALFGGLVRLWRADRSAAEAILLHEVGHLRHGDVLVTGVGSLFEAVVTRWVSIVAVSFLIPVSLVALDETLRFARESVGLGVAASEIVTHELVQWLTLILPGLAAQGLSLLLSVASAFVLPLAAIWVSEISADRFASDAMRSSGGLLRAMERLTARAPWWRWLLLRLSHPPNWVRQYAARHGGRAIVVGVVLLLYPLAYLARLGILLAYHIVNLCMAGAGAGRAAGVLARGIRTYTEAITPVWMAMTAAVLLWPVLAPRWERFFGGARGSARPRGLSVCGAAAAGLVVLLGIGNLVRVLVRP